MKQEGLIAGGPWSGEKTFAGLLLNWEQVERNWAFLSRSRAGISLEFRDQSCLNKDGCNYNK